MTPISSIKATGKTTLYAFPGGVALSTWLTYRRLLTETAPGYYTVTVDETIGNGAWYLFEGETQPASYNDGLNEIWDFTEPNIGTGTYSVSINVLSSGLPVLATVSILQAGNIVAWQETGLSGTAVFALDAGSYTLNVVANGYASVAGQALNVAAASSVTVSMTAGSVVIPSPGLCVVRFVVRDAGATVKHARVEALLDTQNSTTDGNLIAMSTTSGVTDANGIVDLTLIRRDSFTAGGVYHVTVLASSNERPLYDRRVYVMNASIGTADKLIPA